MDDTKVYHHIPAGWTLEGARTLVHAGAEKVAVRFDGTHPIFVSVGPGDDALSVPIDTIAALLHEAGLQDAAQQILRLSWAEPDQEDE
jgi:hypothetical protein